MITSQHIAMLNLCSGGASGAAHVLDILSVLHVLHRYVQLLQGHNLHAKLGMKELAYLRESFQT